jgi:hypothetical protein
MPNLWQEFGIFGRFTRKTEQKCPLPRATRKGIDYHAGIGSATIWSHMILILCMCGGAMPQPWKAINT